MGADRADREFLETTGRRFEPDLTISEFFGCDITPGRGRRCCDVALQLREAKCSPQLTAPRIDAPSFV
jgi:hypothetical protein